MAGKLEYLLKIVPELDKKKYEVLKNKIEEYEGGNLVTFTPDEARKLKGLLSGIMDDVGEKASGLGAKIAQGVRDGLSKADLESALGFDIGKLKETVDIVNKLSDMLTQLSGSDSWMKNSGGFVKSLAEAKKQIEGFQAELKPIGSSFIEVGRSITKMHENIVQITTDIEKLQDAVLKVDSSNFTVVGNEASKVALKVNKAIKEMEAMRSSVDALSSNDYASKFKFGEDLQTQFYEIDEEIGNLDEKIESLYNKYSKMSYSDKGFESTRKELLQSYQKRAELYRQLELVDQKYISKRTKDDSLLTFNSIDSKQEIANNRGLIDSIINDTKMYLGEISNSFKTTKDGINIPLKLPSQLDLIKTINNYIKEINDSDSIDPIKINRYDVANFIEDESKQRYKDNPADPDVNTTKLVEKTEKRFNAIGEAIGKGQESILTQTNEWREKMKEALSFEKGDLELNFSKISFDQLYNDLQEYFSDEENLIDIHLNKEILQQEIKDALGNGDISVGGGAGGTINGVVSLDPKTLAMALKAALTGDYSVFEQKPDKKQTLESDKKPKALFLDPSDKYNQMMAESFRDLAKSSLKKGAPAEKLKKFFESKLIDVDEATGRPKGIDLGKIAEGTTIEILDALAKLIQSEGNTIIDQFDEFMKNGAKNATNLNFRKNLNELLLSLNIGQDLVSTDMRRVKSIEVFKDYFAKAQLTYGINDIQKTNRKDYKIPTTDEINELMVLAKEQGFAPIVDALGVLGKARDQMTDVNSESQKKEFLDAVKVFEQTVSSFYRDMIRYLSTFEMDVSVKGVKKAYRVRGRKNLRNIQDKLNGDDSNISDVKIYKDPSTGRLGTSTAKREYQMMYVHGGKSDLIVPPPDRTDILYKKIKYDNFQPKEGTSSKAVIEDTIRQNEEKVAAERLTKNDELIKLSEKRTAELAETEAEIEKQIQAKREQRAALEENLAKTKEERSRYDSESKGAKAAQKRLNKAEEVLKNAEKAKTEAQNEADYFNSIDTSAWDAQNAENKKKITTYKQWLKNPEKYRTTISKQMYDPKINALNSEKSHLQASIDSYPAVIASIKDNIKDLKDLQSKAAEQGKLRIVEQKQKEIDDLEYKMQEEENSYKAHIKRMETIASTLNILRNRKYGKDPEGFKSDVEEYLLADFNEKTGKPTGKLIQALADQEKLNASPISAQVRKGAQNKVKKANTAYEKAKQKRDEIANSEDIKIAQILNDLEYEQTVRTANLAQIDEDIAKLEESRKQVSEVQKLKTTDMLANGPQKEEINRLLTKVEEVNKNIQLAKQEAAELDKFVREIYEAPEYNLEYSEAEKNNIEKSTFALRRSTLLNEIVENKKKNSIDFEKEAVKQEDLTKEMSDAINSLFASRNFVDMGSRNFKLDKYSNKDELNAEVSRRLQIKDLNSGIVEFYNRVINDGLESAQNWLNQTLQANKENIIKQEALITSLGNKDSSDYELLQPEIAKADKRLKDSYNNQIEEWFKSINDKIKLKNEGNLDRQQEALIVKEISELFKLINQSVINYKRRFKEDLLSEEQKAFYDKTQNQYNYNKYLDNLVSQAYIDKDTVQKKQELETRKKQLLEDKSKYKPSSKKAKNLDAEIKTLDKEIEYLTKLENKSGIENEITSKIEARQPLLETRKAEILSQIQEEAQAGKKTPELDKELAAINEELAIYTQRAVDAKNAEWLVVFKDDAKFIEKYKQSLRELILLRQEAETAKYKGASNEELSVKYSEIQTKNDSFVTLYEEALANKQKSLLNEISTLSKERKPTKELETLLELVNKELVDIQLNKSRINDSKIGGLIHDADVKTLEIYNEKLKALIEAEQKLALIQAKGLSDEEVDAKKEVTNKRREFKQKVNEAQNNRREIEANNSPRAQALRYLRETEGAYQTALQQRYTVRSRIKRAEGQYDDVRNDLKYSTSWQYKKHLNNAKDREISNYVSSDAYRKAKEAAYSKVDSELAKYIEQELLPEFEAGIRERAKVEFTTTQTYKKLKLGENTTADEIEAAQNQYVEVQVQKYVQNLVHNLSYNKDMPDTGEIMKDNAARMMSYGMQELRNTTLDQFRESDVYLQAQTAVKEEEDKIIAEAVKGLQAIRKEKIKSIKEQTDSAIELLKSAGEDYQPLQEEMKNLTVDYSKIRSEFSGIFDTKTLAAFDPVNRREQLREIRQRLKGMPKGAERTALQAQHDFLNDNDKGYFKNVIGRLVGVAKKNGVNESEAQQLYKILEGLGTQRIRKVDEWAPRIFDEFFNRTDEELLTRARNNLIAREQERARRGISEADSEYSKAARPVVRSVREDLNAKRNQDIEDITDPNLKAWAQKNRDLYNLVESHLQETMKQWLESNFQGMVGDKAQALLDMRKGLIEQYVGNLVKDFASGLKAEKGMLNGINIRKEVEDALVREIESLNAQKEPIDERIAAIEEQRRAAMRFGGIANDEVAQADVLEEQAILEARLVSEKAKQKEITEEITAIEKNGSSAEKGRLNNKLDETNREIEMLQMLIDNREKLIELRKEEQRDAEAARQWSPEQQKLWLNNRIALEKTKLDSDDEGIKKKAEENIVRYTEWLGRIEAKMSEQSEAPKDKGVIGLLASAIKEAIGGAGGGIALDSSGLATEETLRKIAAVLGANGVKVVTDPEMESKLARIKELEAKQRTANKSSSSNERTSSNKTSSTTKTDGSKKKEEETNSTILVGRQYEKELRQKVKDGSIKLEDEINSLIKDIKNSGISADAKLLSQLKLQKAFSLYAWKNSENENIPWATDKNGQVRLTKKGKKVHSYEDLAKYLGIGDDYKLRATENDIKKVNITTPTKEQPQVSNNQSEQFKAEKETRIEKEKQTAEERKQTTEVKKKLQLTKEGKALASKINSSAYAESKDLKITNQALLDQIKIVKNETDAEKKLIEQRKLGQMLVRRVVKDTGAEKLNKAAYGQFYSGLKNENLKKGLQEFALTSNRSVNNFVRDQLDMSEEVEKKAKAKKAEAKASQEAAAATEKQAEAEKKVTNAQKERKSTQEKNKTSGLTETEKKELEKLKTETKDYKREYVNEDGNLVAQEVTLQAILAAVRAIKDGGVPKGGRSSASSTRQNKKNFNAQRFVNAANNQYDNLEGVFGKEFGFNEKTSNKSRVLQEYLSAYKVLQEMQAKTNKSESSQKALKEQAARVKYLGQEFRKSANEAERLKEYVDQSSQLSFIDKKGRFIELSGQTEVKNTENLRSQMEAYAKSLGHVNMENVKYNATKKEMTFVTRIDNEHVADMVVKYNDATNALSLYSKQQRESLSGLKLIGAEFQKKVKQILQYTASITSIYRVVSMVRQGIQYVKEIDSALTELKKVTDETAETYDRFLGTASKTAAKVGSTIKEIINSTADWARLNI